MKNLKKVLALVLAFATASTMFAGAALYSDVEPGSEYSEAISFLTDLGVITGDTDGNYYPDNTITRAEACALIARMMTGETDVSNWSNASNFLDVSSYHWAESAIGYCVVNGVVKGDGDGNFRPEDAVTDQEFVTMLTRALGYDTPSAPLSYPYGNLTVAQDKGLLEDVSIDPTSPALRGEDAQMVYNSVFAPYARSLSYDNSIYSSVTDHDSTNTIAYEVFGLTRYMADDDGVIVDDDDDCEAHEWVITGVVSDEEDMYTAVAIDHDGDVVEMGDEGFVFEYEGDATMYIGYAVELWGSVDHYDDNVVEAIKVLNDQAVYDWNSSMELFDDEDVEIDDVDLELTGIVVAGGVLVDLDEYVAVMDYFADDSDIDTVEEAFNLYNGMQYTFFDWDNDGEIDCVVPSVVLYGEVTNLTSSTMRVTTTQGDKLVFDADETDMAVEDVSSEFSYLLSVMYNDDYTDMDDHDVYYEIPEDLEEGDIIEIAILGQLYEDGIYVDMSIVGYETVDITGTDMDDGYAEFDDVVIPLADDAFYISGAYDVYYDLDEDDDIMYDIYVDRNGFVIDIVESDTAYTGYLFVTGWDNGSTGTGSKYDAVISYVGDDNEFYEDVTVETDADIYAYMDHSVDNSDDELEQVYDVDVDRGIKEEHMVVGRAFKYAMNDDGEITKLTEVAYEVKTDDYSFTDKNDRFTDDVDKESYYLTDAKVVFAINADAVTEIEDGTKGGNMEIDDGDVIAVEVDAIPDIGTGENTNAIEFGARFDIDDSYNDEIGAAILCVSSFSYFEGVNVYFAIISELDAKSDYYKVDAYIPQAEGGATYVTIDDDDVEFVAITEGYYKDLNNGAINDMDDLVDFFESDEGDNSPVYAEVEMNEDGEIISIELMDMVHGRGYDAYEGSTYAVARMVAEQVGSDYIDLNYLQYVGYDDDTYAVMVNAGDDVYGNYDDSTVFAVIDEDIDIWLPTLVEGETEYAVPVFEDFDATSDFEEGSASDMDSYLEEVDESEYVVVDVVIEGSASDFKDDDFDIIAVQYFDEFMSTAYAVVAPTYTISVDADDIYKSAYTEATTGVVADLYETVDGESVLVAEDVVFIEYGSTGDITYELKDSNSSVIAQKTVDIDGLDVGVYTVTIPYEAETTTAGETISRTATFVYIVEQLEITAKPDEDGALNSTNAPIVFAAFEAYDADVLGTSSETGLDAASLTAIHEDGSMTFSKDLVENKVYVFAFETNNIAVTITVTGTDGSTVVS